MNQQEELRIPVVPVPHTVLFPGAVIPLVVFEENLVTLVDDVCSGVDFTLGVVFAPPSEVLDELPPAPVMGTLAQIIKHKRSPSGELSLMVKGLARLRIDEFVQRSPYPVARAELVADVEPASSRPMRDRVLEVFDRYLSLCGGEVGAVRENLRRASTLGAAVDMALACLRADPEERQRLLETLDSSERAERLIRMVEERVEAEPSGPGRRDGPLTGFSLN